MSERGLSTMLVAVVKKSEEVVSHSHVATRSRRGVSSTIIISSGRRRLLGV